jgi:YbgC/YbaW family acyl-CoA thioester hydrolase
MSASSFQYTYRVTYADCTAGNHIYYGRYLALLEAGRGEFFRHLGMPFLYWQEQGVLFPVAECQLRYHAPARYDDTLGIEVWVSVIRGARLGFGYRITRQDGVLVLEANTLHACTGLNERPRRLPPELGAALQNYLRPLTACEPTPSGV